MTSGIDRWQRVLAATTATGDAPNPHALCVACVGILGVKGAAIALLGPSPAAAAYASGTATQRLEELQITLGEGPSVQAYAGGVPVLVPDLAGLPPGKWVGFGPAAVAEGVGSVFSFPLQVGAARVGTLTLYRGETGMLGDDLYPDTIVVAAEITKLILTWQGHAPAGMLAAELDGAYQAAVHQASGMISVQLGIGVGEALAVLRARSFTTSRSVADVARDVVGRRIRFSD